MWVVGRTFERGDWLSAKESPFHRGEKEIQKRLGVADRIEQLGRRTIQRQMPERQQAFFSALPLLFVGTADVSGRPWASVLVRHPGFLQPVNAGLLRVNARPIYGDPLQSALFEDAHIGILGMDFATRNRARMNGTVANVGEVGFEIRVAQSFGNCDWYIQIREPTLQTGPGAVGEKRRVHREKTLPKEIRHENKQVNTGIFKAPAQGRVMLRRLNLDGDGQADRWGHRGAFRAVYAYSLENYDYWRRELGRADFEHGQFGENFTVEGMLDDDICVGDVFRIGNALVEVSQPRIPCYKLAIKMGIDDFQKRFLNSGWVGFYLRVLEEGEVGAGDVVEHVGRDPNGMTVREVSDLLFLNTEDPEPGFVVATSVRAGATVLAMAVARETAPYGIQVNAIQPNYLYSEMYYPKARFIDDPQGREQIASIVPAGRLGKPEEFGELVEFFVSGRSPFTTAQVINFTGGWP